MKAKVLFILLSLVIPFNAFGVLKEKNIGNTLSILRTELNKHHEELEMQSEFMKEQQERIRRNIFSVLNQSNQNSLMLYSQKSEYIFDLTYACHEATEQYREFQKSVMPFKKFITQTDTEIARYDSLISNLSTMPTMALDSTAAIDRNVCLTLAVNIRRTLQENKNQFNDIVGYYKMAEERLRYLNDYANKRYGDIQASIFNNGGENYLTILSNLRTNLKETQISISNKYKRYHRVKSDWDVNMIFSLFGSILLYALISIAINLLVIKYLMPRRFRSKAFLEKRRCITLAMSVVMLAAILGIVRLTVNQNFLIMASNLLVAYMWMLGVILISLLLRLDGKQITSGFHIYAPLIFIGFLVITFRIILIPNDLVNLILPPTLLVCALWQWAVIKRHSRSIPKNDKFYSYTSLFIFVLSVICSWIGYTLLSVQLLIWWVMQLTCILTIICIQGWIKARAEKKDYHNKPITKVWAYYLFKDVILPIMGVFSILVSIYWAADVFNLSSTTWQIFNSKFVDSKNFTASIFTITQIINLYFIFSYINKTVKALILEYYERVDKTSAASKYTMAKNVVQLLVWGIWLLISLNIFHVSNTWLVVISGGLSTGIGFASKDLLENIYYGVSLMAGRVKVGDWIVCDGIRGKVSSISYTSTMLEATDGSVIAFTNSQLFTKNYKNMTKNHGYQLDILEVGVAYGTDIPHVKKLLIDAISQLDCIYKKKPVNIVLKSFDDSSLLLKILVWVPVLTQYGDDGKILECVYKTLNDNNIEIPFPKRDVHIIHSEE